MIGMTFIWTLCTEKKKPRFDQKLDVLKESFWAYCKQGWLLKAHFEKKKNEAWKIVDIVSNTRDNYIMGKNH